MDCVSVVLQNSLVRNPVCYKHVIFLSKILGEHGQSFLSALSRSMFFFLLSRPSLHNYVPFLSFFHLYRPAGKELKGCNPKLQHLANA